MIDGLRVPVNLTSRESLRMFDLADIWATRTGKDVRLVSANDIQRSMASRVRVRADCIRATISDCDGTPAIAP